MKHIFIALCLMCALLLPAQIANAHVLIKDSSGETGAILHILPDDDPVAGESATLFFDMQDTPLDATDVSLRITQLQTANRADVSTNRDESLVTAEYVFPTQGVYEIAYTVTSNGKASYFNETTRISRGVAPENMTTVRYPWAEILLVATMSIAASIAIIGLNRRKDITKHSRF